MNRQKSRKHAKRHFYAPSHSSDTFCHFCQLLAKRRPRLRCASQNNPGFLLLSRGSTFWTTSGRLFCHIPVGTAVYSGPLLGLLLGYFYALFVTFAGFISREESGQAARSRGIGPEVSGTSESDESTGFLLLDKSDESARFLWAG